MPNPEGKGYSHQYKLQEINGDKIIVDEISCLMWQQIGSSETMTFENAKNWIIELNQKGFAGFNDWRLPTLEEAMSLMEPEQKKSRYINPMFDGKKPYIWTADWIWIQGESDAAWIVSFNNGNCDFRYFVLYHYVRAVRSGQSDKSD